MNIKSLMIGLAGVAALGLASLPAQANVVYAGQYTYLGSFTVPPGTPSSESFSRGQNDGFPSGAFNDYWIFDVSPDATGQLSVNFVPIGSIGNFFGGIYEASGFACTVTCAGGTVGGLIGGSGAPGIFTGIQGPLPAGQYAVQVTGTNLGAGTSNQTSYTGQVAFVPVPVSEPGSLALLGLGLLGLGAARRRRA